VRVGKSVVITSNVISQGVVQEISGSINVIPPGPAEIIL